MATKEVKMPVQFITDCIAAGMNTPAEWETEWKAREATTTPAVIVNIHEAKTDLSRLLTRVLGGEETIIAKAGTPIARLVPITEKPHRRVPGTALGKVTIAPDFDAPLPEPILSDFEQ